MGATNIISFVALEILRLTSFYFNIQLFFKMQQVNNKRSLTKFNHLIKLCANFSDFFTLGKVRLLVLISPENILHTAYVYMYVRAVLEKKTVPTFFLGLNIMPVI